MRALLRWLALAGAVLALGSAQSRADERESVTLPSVEVVATTPLPAADTPVDRVPAATRRYDAAALAGHHARDLPDFLEQIAPGVTINASQGNPHQPDISLRGFAASPVLGTPQGLSVFVDGVRVNEPFGDVVNWDLIAPGAIERLDLVQGSRPAFGLNTLGGALAVTTRSGREHPGWRAEASAARPGRRELSLEAGRAQEEMDAYLTVRGADDDGWATHNASRLRQLFGKLGWSASADSALTASLTLADNTLEGTQTLPDAFLPDTRAAYTHPDRNRNRLAFVVLNGHRAVSAGWRVDGNLYLRVLRTDNLSSNVADDPDAPGPASNERSSIDQRGHGLTVRATHEGRLGTRAHAFTLGLTAEANRAGYTRATQPAVFDGTRAAVGIGPFEPETDANTRQRHLSLFVAENVNLAGDWWLDASARAQRSAVRIEDASGSAPQLNGDHRFRRGLVSLGLAHAPREGPSLYAGYSEGLRVPTAIELACADPAVPCKLPNNFLADPPLDPILARTWELGARGRAGPVTRWSLALYRTDLENDIQFISAGQAVNAGTFRNVGRTRRQGLELSLETRWGALATTLGYAFLDARYRTPFVVHAPANSAADADGNVAVRAGDRLPDAPRHSLKLGFALDVGDRLRLGLRALHTSARFARGDEGNQDAHGPVAGYTVLHADARWEAAAGLEFFLRVDNLTDRRYATVGVLGYDAFTGPGHAYDGAHAVPALFRGYGAPRTVTVGVAARW